MNPVQNFEIFAPKLVDRKEYLSAGHRACQGCGEVLALRHILKALGDDVVVANATGCMEIISSGYPRRPGKFPTSMSLSRTPLPWDPESRRP